ncbi:MAG: hypothetical protein J0G35_05480, partial [Acidobacteriales bacterium]|nr:hypothetical protein [Terriglobales bacterium]
YERDPAIETKHNSPLVFTRTSSTIALVLQQPCPAGGTVFYEHGLYCIDVAKAHCIFSSLFLSGFLREVFFRPKSSAGRNF